MSYCYRLSLSLLFIYRYRFQFTHNTFTKLATAQKLIENKHLALVLWI